MSEPYSVEYLDVGNGHQIYTEQSGNPEGQPVLVLHGGPGGSSGLSFRQYFDPEKYRIVFFYQRGCGFSKYTDPLKANTTQDLLSDMETIRNRYGIGRWHIYGSSWGSTLALAYAEAFPDQVISLLLRGIYLGSGMEDSWLFEWGARQLFPDKYAPVENFLKEMGLEANLKNMSKIIMTGDFNNACDLARLLDNWEFYLLKLQQLNEPEVIPESGKQKMLDGKRIMFHYQDHKCFLKPGELLRNASELKRIPGVIIQGRYDVICPVASAWKLHMVWPEAKFEIVPLAGHHHSDPENLAKILEYTAKFSQIAA